jgi:hypothetical protein
MDSYLSSGSSASYVEVTPNVPSTAFTALVNAQWTADAGGGFSIDGTNRTIEFSISGTSGHRTNFTIGLSSTNKHWYKRDSGSGDLNLWRNGWIDNL